MPGPESPRRIEDDDEDEHEDDGREDGEPPGPGPSLSFGVDSRGHTCKNMAAEKGPSTAESPVKGAALSEFKHFGVPTKAKQPNETYLEGAKVYITDPEKHPYKIEFLRFEVGSPLPKIVQKNPHAAFMVSHLAQALEGKKVLIPPFDATPTLSVAFIQDGDAVIELMQAK